MEYKLNALSIYEYGQRKDKEGKPHQEDWIYPSFGSINNEKDRFFILCDGMGGHAAGEVASAAVCEAMSQTINEALSEGEKFTEEILLKAIEAAYNLLDKRDTSEESQKKMGTTMTFLMFHEDGVTMAHIGDSRIYHIRPTDDEYARIIRQTVDHSLVNDLLKIGEITPEEAETFPQKNVITRAMQPNLGHRHKADIVTFRNIRPGDYFYMCSDGMLEQTSDKNLCWIFNNNVSDEQKQKMLVDNSRHNKDNHSAHIIHILDVQPESEIEDDPIPASDESEVDDGYEIVAPEFEEQDKSEEAASGDKHKTTVEGGTEVSSSTFQRKQGTDNNDRGRNKLMWRILACIAIAILAIGGVLITKFSEKKEVTPSQKEETQVTPPTKDAKPRKEATSVNPATNSDNASQDNQNPSTGSDDESSSGTPSVESDTAQPQEPATSTDPSAEEPTQNAQQPQDAPSASEGKSQFQIVQSALENSQTSEEETVPQSDVTKVQNSNNANKPQNK